MELIALAEQVVSVVLQLLLVVFLLQGPFRKYFVLLLYSLVYLLTSLLEVVVVRSGGRATPLYNRVYWGDEIVLDLLLFFMVITLTYQATEGSPLRAAVGKLLGGAVIIALALPFVIVNRPYFNNHWFSLTSQILNFGGLIMNLALWTALIGSKRRDPQSLVVSAGLGVAVAGQAIYYGILQLTKNSIALDFADLLNVLAHISGVAIWCWAFRPAKRTERSGPTSAVTTNA